MSTYTARDLTTKKRYGFDRLDELAEKISGTQDAVWDDHVTVKREDPSLAIASLQVNDTWHEVEMDAAAWNAPGAR